MEEERLYPKPIAWLVSESGSMDDTPVYDDGLALGRNHAAGSEQLGELGYRDFSFLEFPDSLLADVHCLLVAMQNSASPTTHTYDVHLCNLSDAGIWVNDLLLDPGQSLKLQDGDWVCLAQVNDNDEEDRDEGLEFQFRVAGEGSITDGESPTASVQEAVAHPFSNSRLKRDGRHDAVSDEMASAMPYCPLCSGLLDAAVTLQPCCHTFCATCLSHHIGNQLQAGVPVTCPVGCLGPRRVVQAVHQRSRVDSWILNGHTPPQPPTLPSVTPGGYCRFVNLTESDEPQAASPDQQRLGSPHLSAFASPQANPDDSVGSNTGFAATSMSSQQGSYSNNWDPDLRLVDSALLWAYEKALLESGSSSPDKSSDDTADDDDEDEGDSPPASPAYRPQVPDSEVETENDEPDMQQPDNDGDDDVSILPQDSLTALPSHVFDALPGPPLRISVRTSAHLPASETSAASTPQRANLNSPTRLLRRLAYVHSPVFSGPDTVDGNSDNEDHVNEQQMPQHGLYDSRIRSLLEGRGINLDTTGGSEQGCGSPAAVPIDEQSYSCSPASHSWPSQTTSGWVQGSESSLQDATASPVAVSACANTNQPCSSLSTGPRTTYAYHTHVSPMEGMHSTTVQRHATYHLYPGQTYVTNQHPDVQQQQQVSDGLTVKTTTLTQDYAATPTAAAAVHMHPPIPYHHRRSIGSNFSMFMHSTAVSESHAASASSQPVTPTHYDLPDGTNSPHSCTSLMETARRLMQPSNPIPTTPAAAAALASAMLAGEYPQAPPRAARPAVWPLGSHQHAVSQHTTPTMSQPSMISTAHPETVINDHFSTYTALSVLQGRSAVGTNSHTAWLQRQLAMLEQRAGPAVAGEPTQQQQQGSTFLTGIPESSLQIRWLDRFRQAIANRSGASSNSSTMNRTTQSSARTPTHTTAAPPMTSAFQVPFNMMGAGHNAYDSQWNQTQHIHHHAPANWQHNDNSNPAACSSHAHANLQPPHATSATTTTHGRVWDVVGGLGLPVHNHNDGMSYLKGRSSAAIVGVVTDTQPTRANSQHAAITTSGSSASVFRSPHSMHVLCALHDHRLPMDLTTWRATLCDRVLMQLRLACSPASGRGHVSSPADIVHALEIMARLSWCNPDVKEALVGNGVIARLLQCMTAFKTSSAVQTACCLALGSLAAGKSDATLTNQWEVAKALGVEAIAAAMQNFEAEPMVQLAACMACTTLAAGNSMMQANICQLCLAPVMRALSCHSDILAIQAKGFVLLGVLVQGEERLLDAIRSRVVEAHVPAALYAALSTHGRALDAVLWPCLFCAQQLLADGRLLQITVAFARQARLVSCISACLESHAQRAAQHQQPEDGIIMSTGRNVVRLLEIEQARLRQKYMRLAAYGSALCAVTAITVYTRRRCKTH